MRIFNLPRGAGKTTRMLYASEFTKSPILCSNQCVKNKILDKARILDIDIPEPITVSELLGGSKTKETNDILVDEALSVLCELIRQSSGRTVSGIAFSDENNTEIVQ